MYTIDKHIPPPKPRTRYPFDVMDVGDSFYVNALFPIRGSTLISVRSCVSQINAKHKRYCKDKRWTTRTDEYGIRVWRIK